MTKAIESIKVRRIPDGQLLELGFSKETIQEKMPV